MRNEEAIRYCDEYLERHIADIDKEFLKIAKEALQQEPCSNCCNGNQIEKAKLCQKSYLAGMEHKQEACEDAISRQEALKYFEGWKNQIKYYHPYAKNFDIPYEEAIQMIKDVPPVKCVSLEKPNKCEDAISADVLNHWIGAEVLDSIRAEIDQYLFQNEFGSGYRKEISQIIDKYKAESEDKE